MVTSKPESPLKPQVGALRAQLNGRAGGASRGEPPSMKPGGRDRTAGPVAKVDLDTDRMKQTRAWLASLSAEYEATPTNPDCAPLAVPRGAEPAQLESNHATRGEGHHCECNEYFSV